MRSTTSGAGSAARAHPDQRRRRRRPRRNRQPAQRMDGPATYPRRRLRPPHAGGSRAPAAVALLARAAAQGQDRHLHERLVPRGADRRASPASIGDADSTSIWRKSGARSGCSPTKASCCSSSGSTCRTTPRRSALHKLEATRRRAGGSRRRTSARSSSTASRTRSGSTCCARRRPATAPWYVVEGADERYRSLTVGKILLDAMQRTLARRRHGAPRQGRGAARRRSIDNVDADPRARPLDKTLTDAEYDGASSRNTRAGCEAVARHKRFGERALVLVFEGTDAAGKGGAIRRVTARARRAPVHDHPGRRADRRGARAALPLALLAPLPARGGIAIFDRTLVRPRAGRARRGLLRGRRLDARLRRDQRLRGAAGEAGVDRRASSGCRSARKSS